MFDNKIIKQILNKFQNRKLTILNENVKDKTMDINIHLEEMKMEKQKTPNIQEILSEFENRINNNMIKMENRIITNVATMMNNFKSEVKSDINNLKNEMNNRFDKLESRVSTLESFHKEDLIKK